MCELKYQEQVEIDFDGEYLRIKSYDKEGNDQHIEIANQYIDLFLKEISKSLESN